MGSMKLKPSTWNRKQLLPALVLLTICYQLIFNVMLFSAVERDAGQDECSAAAGVGNADSPHCLEMRLFRSWREAEMSTEDDAPGLLQPAEQPTKAAGTDKVEANTLPLRAKGRDGVESQSVANPIESHEARIQKRHALFDQLEQSVRASLNTSSNMTPWAKDLMSLQQHLESEMTSQEAIRERKAKFDRLEKSVRASLNSSAVTPWASNLVALQKHLEDEMHTSERAHASAHLYALHEARHAQHLAHRKDVTGEISERMTNLEKHLANLVSERKAWEAKLLVKYGAPVASTTTAVKNFLEKQLQWATVAGWSKVSWRPKPSWTGLMSDKMSVVLRQDVRHMHWSGVIPKVACITTIQSSRHTKARIMYFVNNFRLQDYEGPRQLVFVYHHSDTTAAELINTYVDGTYIKGVAAFGDNVFSSGAALRYGAWSSDADVVARWDFEEWHDPSRLSMQIRALAKTSRPACVIRLPRDANNQQAFSGSSLVGERSWMNKHWHPLAPEESTLLETSEAAHVVKLDMQSDSLTSNMSHIKEAFDAAPKQEIQSDTKKTDDWNIWQPQCLQFEESKSPGVDGQGLEATIGETVGPDMSKQFHKLMKRRDDITQKLQLLCLQSVLEKDVHKQMFMRRHVDEMAGIRGDLDKHISAMTALFAA